ncbi:phosphoribosylglycinamide formyltransferase [Glaciecola sp. 1036]|uniref:phosphoribosylglycinamide formyltransferase n=1 Tax=Alteromonadaceae TaxID=72275 RepID=UPI003D002A94
MSKKKVVLLISGNGSNAQAIIDACAEGKINADVVAVISNKPDAFGLERAESANIPAILIDHKTFNDRQAFDQALKDKILSYSPDLVVLAGFMRILTADFVNAFNGKMLNIHPSLLPKYPGLHTHKRALENGDQYHGVSVHFVTDELDGGPIVLQSRIEVLSNDTETSLAQRVAQNEWIIYPLVVSWFCAERLKMQENSALLDNKKLSKTGLQYEDFDNTEFST